jgi:hypothetical protein
VDTNTVDEAHTFSLSVKLTRAMPTGRLRRMERRLRRRARRRHLDAAGLTLWAAMRSVLRDRGVRLPSSESRRRW